MVTLPRIELTLELRVLSHEAFTFLFPENGGKLRARLSPFEYRDEKRIGLGDGFQKIIGQTKRTTIHPCHHFGFVPEQGCPKSLLQSLF